jgi:hypothetical protein
MVLQLEAKVADVAVHNVAPGHVISAPEVIQDFVASDETSRVGSEEIEEALLEWR